MAKKPDKPLLIPLNPGTKVEFNSEDYGTIVISSDPLSREESFEEWQERTEYPPDGWERRLKD